MLGRLLVLICQRSREDARCRRGVGAISGGDVEEGAGRPVQTERRRGMRAPGRRVEVARRLPALDVLFQTINSRRHLRWRRREYERLMLFIGTAGMHFDLTIYSPLTRPSLAQLLIHVFKPLHCDSTPSPNNPSAHEVDGTWFSSFERD